MNKFNYPIVAREGYIHLLIIALASILSTMLWGWWSIPVWVLAVFVLQFFRDPKRTITTQPGAVVSPASGKVVFIGESDSPRHCGGKFIRISVFMNVFSVHSNLVPVTGKIADIEYHSGRFLNAALDKSSAENERNTLHIRCQQGHDIYHDIYCVQIAGLIARRILCYLQTGDHVQIGERYGFIRFGSRVDVYLPAGCRIDVKLGQSIDSGNVIGLLPGY